MAVVIKELSIEVLGNIVKNFDGTNTILRVTQEQAEQIHTELGLVLEFFSGQKLRGNYDPTPVSPIDDLANQTAGADPQQVQTNA